ncbi:hypothetical protein LCGC14_0390370 [marine sediment metagenome]|uniref:Uncharacterized protein n=1 Tax=marine sediment metagenome TaxID=412755 RepID=A0A0F9THP6_9ZZZZ
MGLKEDIEKKLAAETKYSSRYEILAIELSIIEALDKLADEFLTIKATAASERR